MAICTCTTDSRAVDTTGCPTHSYSPSGTQLTLQSTPLNLWTSRGNLNDKLREFAIRYESAREWDDPSVDNKAEMDAITADMEQAITALFQQVLTSLKIEMEKKKKDPATFESRLNTTVFPIKYTGFNEGISECQRVIDGVLK